MLQQLHDTCTLLLKGECLYHVTLLCKNSINVGFGTLVGLNIPCLTPPFCLKVENGFHNSLSFIIIMNNFQQHFSFILNPALQPPAIQPPSLQPPAIQPPALQPPAIQPPALQPPAPFQLVQGRKPRSKQLLHQGFRYIQNGGHGDKKYWRCFYHKKDINNPLIYASQFSTLLMTLLPELPAPTTTLQMMLATL